MDSTMAPQLAADEMFPEGASYIDIDESASMPSVSMDLGSEKHVHADFYEDFGDLFDDDDFEM